MMKQFAIATLGCKVNQCESESLAAQLTGAGGGDRSWSVFSGEGSADVVVVNTCAVTARAAMQSRQAIRQSVRHHPGARIIVTGCYAQIAPQEVAAIEGVDEVVGRLRKNAIADIVLDRLTAGAAHPANWFAAGDQMAITPPGTGGGRTRPFLKIQDGCDAGCSYCIVPRARGKSRSLPTDAVLDNIARLGQAGYHEAVLTGIHLGSYGRDLNPPKRLADLLCEIRSRQLIDRVRLSSIEPRELTDDIVDLVSESNRDAARPSDRRRGMVCPHFHIPLQSGDDRILEAMKRPYDAAFFSDLVNRLYQRLPDAAVGADVLVGFPGEDEGRFENTCRLIENLPLAYLHVFPFSPRKGTPAFSYPGRVAPATLKARCRRARQLGRRKKMAFYRRFIGRRVEVLVESNRDADSGLLKGVTPNYLSVLLQGGEHLKNTLVETRIDGLVEDRRGGIHGICQK